MPLVLPRPAPAPDLSSPHTPHRARVSPLTNHSQRPTQRAKELRKGLRGT